MTAPFRGSGPWRGRGPFLGRGPWAGKAPFGFNAGLPFQISVTGAQLRAALNDPTAWGTTGAATGWLLPGLGGARLSGDCRTSVAMQTEADGTVGYAAHNLLVQSQALNVSPWGGSNVTLTAGQSDPIGSNTAWRIEATVAGAATISQVISGAGRPDGITGQVYLKKGTGATVLNSFILRDSTAGIERLWVRINLDTGGITYLAGSSGVTVTDVGGGWWRVVATSTAFPAGNNVQLYVAGAGFSEPAGGFTLAWAPQLNLGPTALPYVPTTTAARFGPAIDWLSGIGAYGIRSESARTNLVLYSRDLTNAAWTKTDATAALTATGVDGVANTASTLTATAGNGTALQAITSASAARALSVYLRRRTGTGTVETTIDGGTTWVPRTLTSSWVRFDTLATVTDPSVGVRIVTSGDEVDVDIVQCESGTEASSPILTYAAAATRAADTLVVLDSGWINQTEGTLVADGSFTRIVGNGPLLALRSTNVAGVQIGRNTGGGGATELDAYVQNTGDQAWLRFAANVVAGQQYRVACAYQVNNFAASAAGLTTLVDTSGTVPAMTELLIGQGTNASSPLGGHLTRIRYSRRRASNGQLQALTV